MFLSARTCCAVSSEENRLPGKISCRVFSAPFRLWSWGWFLWGPRWFLWTPDRDFDGERETKQTTNQHERQATENGKRGCELYRKSLATMGIRVGPGRWSRNRRMKMRVLSEIDERLEQILGNFCKALTLTSDHLGCVEMSALHVFPRISRFRLSALHVFPRVIQRNTECGTRK